MSDIAREVRKGRSTLYYYFNNKKEVFDAVILEDTTAIFSAASVRTSEWVSFKENLLAYNHAKLEGISVLIERYTRIVADIRENPALILSIKKQLDAKEVSVFKQLLVWGIARKDIAELNSKDLDYLTTTLVTALSSMEQELFLHGRIEDMVVRLEWLTTILGKGLK